MKRWILVLVATAGCAVVVLLCRQPGLFEGARRQVSTDYGEGAARLKTSNRGGTPMPGALLGPDTVVERELAGGEIHVFSIILERHGFFHVVLRQRGIDAAVALFDPQGRQLLVIDTPNGSEGPEPLAVVAETTGMHRLEVEAGTADNKGRYELQVEALRPAGETDRALARAMQVFAQAELLGTAPEVDTRRDALERYREALGLWQSLDKAPRLRALTLRRMGQVTYSLGEVRNSVEHFAGALDLYPTHGNDWELIPLYNDAGNAYRLAGEPRVAQSCFERAFEMSQRLGRGSAMAISLNNLGMLHDSIGQPQQALGFYDRALAEWQKVGRPLQEATTLHNIGVSYTSLGRMEEGFDFLERALEMRRAQDDRGGQAAALTALGWVHFSEGDYAATLSACDEALVLRHAVGDRQGEAVTLDLRANAFRQRGELQKALDSYREALIRSDGSRLNKAYTLTNLGSLFCTLKQPEKALDYFHRSIELFRQIEDLNGQSYALWARAEAELQRGNLTRARAHLEESLGIVESVRSRLQSGALRRSYLATHHDYYGAYIDLLMRLAEENDGEGYATQAFEANERARARSTLESLAEARAGIRTTAAPELLKRERALRERINAKESSRIDLLDAGGSSTQVAVLAAELRSLLLEYEKLQTELRASSPLDAAVSEPQPLGLEEIQQEVLDEDTILLTFSLGEKRSFLWVVSRSSLTSHVLPPGPEIERLAREVYNLLPQRHKWGMERQVTLSAAALSRMILGPVSGLLGHKRLLIVAGGALQYVPFAALPITSGDTGEAGGPWVPLLTNHEIIVLPSASVLALQRRALAGRPPASKQLAVVADPVFDRDDPRIGKQAYSDSKAGHDEGTTADLDERPVVGRGSAAGRDSSLGRTDLDRTVRDLDAQGFERLVYTGEEAAAILAVFPEDEDLKALGFAASRETVMSGELSDYRIVHFATHGLINDKHPSLSGLVLSLVDKAGRSQEGFLRVHEILDLELTADLVVLSACRTALGKEVKGEGLLGLTQSFFYAGATRVLVSLWNVNDMATAELMERFYRRMLQDGLEPAQALRAAQLSMLAGEEWQAPYYWAGFVLQGEWR